MIPPAPTDFWMQVVARVASLVFERETALRAGQGVRLARPLDPAWSNASTPGPVETKIEIGGAAE